jgi:hypothetical protein
LVFDGSAQIPVDMTGAKSIGLGVAEFPRFQTSAAAIVTDTMESCGSVIRQCDRKNSGLLETPHFGIFLRLFGTMVALSFLIGSGAKTGLAFPW